MGKVVCARCGHENGSDAELCEKCGAPIEVEPSTAEINTQTFSTKTPLLPDVVLDMPEKAVVLYFLGNKEPLTVRPRPEITIGRAVMGESESVADLTPYGASEKGVSRKHAKIIYSDDKYHLVDLGSTNGTWVNEQKLAPNELRALRSTDMIRLGNLQMFIYFKAVDSTPKEETIALPEEQIDQMTLAWPAESLSPTHVVNIVGPFLEAVAELQQLRNEALAVKEAKPVILHVIKAGPPINVVVENAREALELTGLILGTLRDQHLIGGGHEAMRGRGPDLRTKSLNDASEIDITRRRLIQIAHRTIDQLPAKPEEPDRTDYVIRMLAILQKLDKANLTLISVSPKGLKK
jgi:hypothetical protein